MLNMLQVQNSAITGNLHFQRWKRKAPLIPIQQHLFGQDIVAAGDF